MTLDTAFERVSLPLAEDFTIARGTTSVAENVILSVSDGEYRGIGGAAPAERYGETVDSVEDDLPALLAVVEDVGDPHQLQRIEGRMRGVAPESPAARCAVSIALHDLVCKRVDLPLFRYWGLDPDESPRTSYTLSIDDPDRVATGARELVGDGFTILKLKLGGDRDVERVRAVREAVPDATIRVDANEAWTPEEAVETIDALADLGVEFVEQPVPAGDDDGLRFVHERAALPIAADESCVDLADVPRIADRVDVVNVKLVKCGGLREAIRTIHAARAHGLDVMLGCMVESNASIAAACHLAPLLDYADLDGSLLLREDPYDGVGLAGGRIALDPETPGTGAVELSGPFI